MLLVLEVVTILLIAILELAKIMNSDLIEFISPFSLDLSQTSNFSVPRKQKLTHDHVQNVLRMRTILILFLRELKQLVGI